MEFPLYVDEMARSAIDRLRMLPEGNTVDFAFFTDVHNCTNYADRALYAIGEINKRYKIDFVCIGGDYLCNNQWTDREEARRQHREMAGIISKYQNEVPIIALRGNHDDNHMGGAGATLLTEEIHDLIMKPMERFCKTAEKKTLYGYYDVPEKKFRMIYLDVFDPEYIKDGSNVYYKGGRDTVIGNKQLKWLCEKALILPEKDWLVAVFAHAFPIPTPFYKSERFFGGDALVEILSAFKEGDTYTSSGKRGDLSYDVTCDFSAQGKGRLIGYFCGHYHCDWKWTVSELNVVAHLSMASDNFRVGICDDGTKHLKTRGSGEESAFSIFRVYPDKGEVYCIRCGAGPDYCFKFSNRIP